MEESRPQPPGHPAAGRGRDTDEGLQDWAERGPCSGQGHTWVTVVLLLLHLDSAGVLSPWWWLGAGELLPLLQLLWAGVCTPEKAKAQDRVGVVRFPRSPRPQAGLWFPHLGSPATVAGWFLGLPSFLPPSAPPPLLHLKLQAASGRRQDRWQGGCTKHRIYYQTASWPQEPGYWSPIQADGPCFTQSRCWPALSAGGCGVDRWAEPWLSVTTEP